MGDCVENADASDTSVKSRHLDTCSGIPEKSSFSSSKSRPRRRNLAPKDRSKASKLESSSVNKRSSVLKSNYVNKRSRDQGLIKGPRNGCNTGEILSVREARVPENGGKLESSDGPGNDVSFPKRPRSTFERKKANTAVYHLSFGNKKGCSVQNNADVNISSAGDNAKNDSSSKNIRKKPNARKRKSSSLKNKNNEVLEKPYTVRNERSSRGSMDENCDGSLEENAFSVLSSRFHPSCTGISGKESSSSATCVNKSSRIQSPQDKVKSSATQNSPVNMVGRLRPRRNNIGFVRKRRHFYEVSSGNVDPYYVLKQKIKVFCPLDSSWCIGLVKDYNPVSRIHFIKYGDYKEEWISLENVRFKLLLFPSEISHQSNPEKLESIKAWKTNNANRSSSNYELSDNFTESEPIITWLTQPADQLKPNPANILKKRKRNDLMKVEHDLPFSRKRSKCTVQTVTLLNKLPVDSITSERLVNQSCIDIPELKTQTGASYKGLQFVYRRRRFRNCKSLNYVVGHDYVCGSLDGRGCISSSVACDVTSLLEFSLSNKRTLKLMVPLNCIQDFSVGANAFWFFNDIFIQFGGLVSLWPMVHLETVIVDNVTGFRCLNFEGCLRQAVDTVCLIIRVFCQYNKSSNFIDHHMPTTSIGFKIYGLSDHRICLYFVMFSFLHFEISKWICLEKKLLQRHLRVKEVPIVYFNNENIGDIPFFFKGLADGSYSNILKCLKHDCSTNTGMYPVVCFFAEKSIRHHPIPSFPTAPAPILFLSLHLKLLMEKNYLSCTVQNSTSASTEMYADNDKLISDGCSLLGDCYDQVSEITLENMGSLVCCAAATRLTTCNHSKIANDALPLSTDANWIRTSHSFANECNVSVDNTAHGNLGCDASDKTITESQIIPLDVVSYQDAKTPWASLHGGSSNKSERGCSLIMDTQFQQLDQVNKKLLVESMHTSDAFCESRIPGTTAPRSTSKRIRHSSILQNFYHNSDLFREDLPSGFVFSSRKPRTQSSYSLSSGYYDLSSKARRYQCKGPSYRKIRTDNSKRISTMSGNHQSYLGSLTCEANVLVTAGDRGWRECGAEVILETNDHKDCSLSVKISGITKYMLKVHQLLQPGTANRYSHAMMWKGGTDWTLEFTDREQWCTFKEMHEECYNRNLRAASVKNIPIPGVRLIEDADKCMDELSFSRNSHKYIRQIGTEVDMALDPSNVLYDMDSSDEEWISTFKHSLDGEDMNGIELTDDIFESVMDMFEKYAYSQSCDEFTNDEIEEYMTDTVPMDVIKRIYKFWQDKRKKKGLPLIRQFQPALWELYQKQLNEWELAMSRMHHILDYQDKTCFSTKPPLFAFCWRPRGLQTSNKGSKQKSHRKCISTLHQNTYTRRQDSFYEHGRRSNEYSYEADKGFTPDVPYSKISNSRHLRPTSSSFSPRSLSKTPFLTMSSDDSEESYHPMFRKSNKNIDIIKDSSFTPFLYCDKFKSNAYVNPDTYEWQSRKCPDTDVFLKNQADIEELRLRDASSAAQHASKMAKLKKERAQWLLHKADLALHKATVALMIADALKASENALVDDG